MEIRAWPWPVARGGWQHHGLATIVMRRGRYLCAWAGMGQHVRLGVAALLAVRLTELSFGDLEWPGRQMERAIAESSVAEYQKLYVQSVLQHHASGQKIYLKLRIGLLLGPGDRL